MHGGGWGVGDPRMGEGGTYGPWPNVLAKLAARGHLVMAINYRFTGEARFPAQVQDVKAAIRWIRSNAAQYGADAGNVYVWGESAGGFLSVMAGTTCGAAALEPLAPRTGGPAPPPGMLTVHVDPAQSDCVQGAVDWFGPTDLIRMDEQMLPNSPMHHNPPTSPESKLLGCTLPSCPKSLLDEATSLTYITASTPPFLIMHGTSDHSVPLQQSEELYQALRAKGVAAQLVEVVGADHGFAGATPQAKAHLIDMVFDWLDHPGGSGKQTAQSGAPANAPPATFGPPQG
jgi:acetyl esterase/lipase